MQVHDSCRNYSPPKWYFRLSCMWNEYCIELIGLFLGVVVIHACLLPTVLGVFGPGSLDATAKFGDFVGGYAGTLLALGSVLLLVHTLKRQMISDQRERFEGRYFEMLKMHRENVAEMELQQSHGRKIFVLLVRELRLIHEVLRSLATKGDNQLTQKDLMKISYYGLFFGTGPNSSRVLRNALKNYPASLVEALIDQLSSDEIKSKAQEQRKLGYTPFEGHQSRLGHYYRHLFQMFQFVNAHVDEIDFYSYGKTIRAQLSTHEQALLFINSLTELGDDWWISDIMVKYRCVSNLPPDFFDRLSEIDVQRFFNDVDYFEWDDAYAPEMK